MNRFYSQIPKNIFGSGVLMPNIGGSLAYRQAGIEGKRRMERLVGMGLPVNTDISRVKFERMGLGRIPIYSAPRPQPWGTYGSVGMEETPPQLPTPIGIPPKGEEPKPKTEPKSKSQSNGRDYTKEGYEKNRYGYWVKSPQMARGAEPASMTTFSQREKKLEEVPTSIFDTGNPWWVRGATSLKFPFANY